MEENDERQRSRLFDVIESVHAQNREMPIEGIDAAIKKALAEVRENKRQQKKRV